MRRYAARVDSTQKGIVSALRDAGAFVYCIRQPVDLLVYYRGWHLLECKTTRKKRKDQESQDAFCRTFNVPRVMSADEALQAIGAVKVSTSQAIEELMRRTWGAPDEAIDLELTERALPNIESH